MSALGTNGRSLSVTALAKDKCLPVDVLLGLGLHDLPGGGVGISYFDPTGKLIAVKRRTALKAKEGSYWPKNTPLAAYGQWRLDAAHKTGFLILLEGESDCWVTWHHGLPALDIPGASAVKTLERAHIEAIETIYVHREPDNGGKCFVPGVAERLAALGFQGKVYELRMPNGIKDPADLHKANPDRFKSKLEEAIRASTPIELNRPPERNGQGSVAATKVKARELTPFRPFPVEALPAPLAEYVRQGALALGCDPAYLALPVLAVAAGLIGYTRVLRLKRTWRAPSVLWALVIADSGSLKTPAFRLATDYLFKLQRRIDREYQREMAAYTQAIEEHRAKAKEAKEQKTDPPTEPEEPVRRTLFTSDATIEAIAELIGDNPRGLIVSCDELAGWLGSFARYKGKAGGTDLQRWLSMHSAGGFAYHRRTGDKRRIVVPNAAVSVCGGIQPGILANVMGDEFLAAGLAARLLLAMPPRPVKSWSEKEIHPDVEQSFQHTLDALLALNFGRDGEGEQTPHVLHLSLEAKTVWVAWYDAWAREQSAAEGELAAALAKLEEAAARFALVHHVVSHVARGEDDLVPVEVESVEAGVTLARWFAAEARRVYASLTESGEERDTRRLVEWIRSRGGKTTAQHLQNSNSKKFPTSEAANEALNALEEAGYGRWVDRLPHAGGGRPTKDFILHNPSDETDKTPLTDDDSDCDSLRTPSDETHVGSDETLENSGHSEVLSVSSVSGVQSRTPSPAGMPAPNGREVSSDVERVSSDATPRRTLRI